MARELDWSESRVQNEIEQVKNIYYKKS
jgi:hypothetical protein